jgi:hypothetical protein
MRVLLSAVFAVFVAAGSVGADEVYLVNGKVFEDVTAEVVGDKVAIGLSSGGEIRLPLSHVERIERSETAMAVFRERARALFADARSGGAEWLELAYWAREQGLRRAYRESALEAARRTPELPGVASAMRELGYVFEQELDQWLPRSEAMLRRGLVPYGGDWVTPEERDRMIRTADERARRREQDERLDRLTRLVELQTEIELARGLAEAARPEPPAAYYPSPYPSYPVYVVPGHFFPRHPKPPHHHDGHVRDPRPQPPPRSEPPASHRGGREYVQPVEFIDSIPGRLNPGAAPPPDQLRTPSLPRR